MNVKKVSPYEAYYTEINQLAEPNYIYKDESKIVSKDKILALRIQNSIYKELKRIADSIEMLEPLRPKD